MRSVSVQADTALESVAREWIVHLLVAMPVLPNQGIIFDSLRPGEIQTHVNHRKPETWIVSFRGGAGGADTGHYRNPIAAAEAIIDRKHNSAKNN
jgi:hypothetical protein